MYQPAGKLKTSIGAHVADFDARDLWATSSRSQVILGTVWLTWPNLLDDASALMSEDIPALQLERLYVSEDS